MLASGKLEVLDRLLTKLKARGHRVVLFSQVRAVPRCAVPCCAALCRAVLCCAAPLCAGWAAGARGYCSALARFGVWEGAACGGGRGAVE